MSNEHLYGASHRRTKILATIGPSSDDPIVLRKLFEAGVNACRINFSHGSHPEHAERIHRIRAVARDLGIPMPIVGDLKGPEIRVDRQTYELVEGEVWTIEGRAGSPAERRIGISHSGLHRYVPAGQAILLDDGNLELRVESVEDGVIRCRVVTGGELKPNKSINTPGCENGLAVLSEQDMADLAFAHEMEIDWIAISFVKRASDIQAVRTHLEGIGWDDVPLIAKIETMEAVDHLDEIVRWSDGVMVARGDLGVECPIENVPIIQKRTIQLAHKYAKLSIVATQMLDSMIRNPRPTRAEASDVANAVYEGTQVVMLSGETANGLHPLEAVRTMATIVHRAEGVADIPTTRPDVSNQTLELVAGAVRLRDHTKAACIISFVTRGTTAAMLAAFHSPAETIAACFTDRAYHRTALHYGTTPIRFRDTPNLDLAIERITEKIRRRGIADSGQRVIFLFALPHGSRTNNTIRLATIP